MDDLLSEFLTESAESIATLDVELVKLEQNPEPALISSIFRLVHTIKGTCGFIGLPRLETLAHSAENVLGKIRDGELEVTSDAVSLILASIDKIKEILAVIEKTEAEPPGDDAGLIAKLDALAKGEAAPGGAAEAPAPAAKPAAADDDSLFEQIGGAVAVEAAIEIFYSKLLADESLLPFFGNADVGHLKKQQLAFMTAALGGPDNYDGKDLRTAHARLVDEGLGEPHFAAVAGHLRDTLGELSVDEALIDRIMTIVGATKNDVLNLDAEAAPEETAPVAEATAAPAPVEGPASAVTDDKAREVANQIAAEAAGASGGESNIANQSIRVSVQLLENLMTTVSELVLTRNQLLQMVRSSEDSEFKAPLQRLSHITSDLQEGVMKTRMQPIGNAWAKLPRIIRSLAHDLGKKIDLEMVGAETELDRQVLELIKDPLTHMVRNSGDHGLETPAERKAAGKPETGKVRLTAYHEGGHIIIQVSDDGRGINIDRVRAKAVENGLATEAEVEGMSEKQILQFIFRAGFSTAQQVTSVSGRGVGMDVVRTNIERIGGTIDLDTTYGKGSVFTIKIPLTLAIVSALVVESGGEKFAIPQLAVVELVRTKTNSEHKIEVINGTPVLRLRDRLLPLVSLGEVLGLDAATKAANSNAAPSLYEQLGGAPALCAAVDLFYKKVLADESLTPFFENTKLDWLKKQQVAFLTGALGGPERYCGRDMRAAHERLVDAGLKPRHFDSVARHLKATLNELGVPGELVAKVMAVVGSTRADVLNLDQKKTVRLADPGLGNESFIVVTQVGGYTFGIIVDRVFDTEEIVVKPVSPILRNISMFSGNTILGDGSVIMILDPNGIAAASGQRHAAEDLGQAKTAGARTATSEERTALLLFRAGSGTPKAVPLSLVARLEELEIGSIETSDGRPVVQYRGQLMPLISVDPMQTLKTEGRQPVLVFADRARSMGLIVDEIIDIIDEHLDFEVTSQQPGLLGSAVIDDKATDVVDVAYYLRQGSSDWFHQNAATEAGIQRRLLLVDDSPFFRNMLTPVLTAAGYQVTAAADADEALRLLEEETGAYDIIVSDIEMPGKNGFEFARACRTNERLTETPIVALSSRTEPADFDRGREAGFTDYVAKFDRDALLSALSQSLELVKGAA